MNGFAVMWVDAPRWSLPRACADAAIGDGPDPSGDARPGGESHVSHDPKATPEHGGEWLARVRASCAGAKVVVVDDEPAVLQMTSALLMAAGFRTTTFLDGDDALAALRNDPPDLVLLDIQLRGRTGVEICTEIRSDAKLARIPVILVTGAHVSVADQVLGFGVGADDYVLKPWTPELLLSRVAAVLRRVRGAAAEKIVHGALVVDPARREATLEGAVLPLTPTEFHILHRLVASPDRALSRAELLDEATEAGVEVAERNVDVHVLAIRRKLGAFRWLVQTVFRVGYRIAPV